MSLTVRLGDFERIANLQGAMGLALTRTARFVLTRDTNRNALIWPKNAYAD